MTRGTCCRVGARCTVHWWLSDVPERDHGRWSHVFHGRHTNYSEVRFLLLISLSFRSFVQCFDSCGIWPVLKLPLSSLYVNFITKHISLFARKSPFGTIILNGKMVGVIVDIVLILLYITVRLLVVRHGVIAITSLSSIWSQYVVFEWFDCICVLGDTSICFLFFRLVVFSVLHGFVSLSLSVCFSCMFIMFLFLMGLVAWFK